jgi:hypothetical protein
VTARFDLENLSELVREMGNTATHQMRLNLGCGIRYIDKGVGDEPYHVSVCVPRFVGYRRNCVCRVSSCRRSQRSQRTILHIFSARRAIGDRRIADRGSRTTSRRRSASCEPRSCPSLRRIRGVNDEELSPGLVAMATPIYQERREVVAVLNMAAYTSMISIEEMDD